MRAAIAECGRLIRRDAARWIRPEQIADDAEVTPSVVLRLLVRHMALRAVVWFRVASLAHRLGVRGIPSLIQRRMLVKYGFEITPSMDVGGGLYVAHPVGCVLVAERIGENVTVIAGVTFGTRTDARWPTIRDGVFVGAGARVLGGVQVGDGASIGANAVVVHDVEPGTTVVGVPARPITERRR